MADKYTISIVINARDEASKAIASLGEGTQRLGTVALGGLAALAGAAAVAGAGLVKLAADAAPLQGIETQFAAIAERSGQSADAMVAALEKSSAGMVAQTDLMKSFNLAASLVSDDFALRLPEAMEVLTKVSAGTGESMDYLMESLVRGVGRVSPLILDNLGVQMDMNKALEDYAKKYGLDAVETTVDNSAAIAKLNEELGFAARELAASEQAYRDANAEYILAQTYWSEGSVELNKFKAKVDAAALAVDKKKASVAGMNGELAKLQAEHGKTSASSANLTEVLTKDQQQMALFEQIVGKLKEKYADMPPVTENVATSMAALRAKFQNLKDSVGKALLPVFGKILVKLSELAERVFPLVTDFVNDPLMPILDKLAWAFGALVNSVDGTGVCMGSLMDIMYEFLPPDVVNKVFDLIDAIANLAGQVRPFIEMAIQWIAEHVELQDVLAALGVAIASVVVPALIGLVAGVAPIVAAFVGLVAVVAALRSAWETDWGGIRTALTEFWENTAKPALTQLWEWLQINVPVAIQTLSDFWNNTLLPAIQTFWNFMQTSVFPLLQTLWNWLSVNVPIAIQILSDFWNNTLLPAITAVWGFISEYLLPLFTTLIELGIAVMSLAVEALAGIWQNYLYPALEDVWTMISENVLPIFEALINKIKGPLGEALTWLKDELLKPIKDAFEKIKEIIKAVIEKIEDFIDAVNRAKQGMKDWLPGSPSVVELGFLGVAEAIEKSTIPAAKALADVMGNLSMPLAGAGAGGGVVNNIHTNYYNQTVNTRAETSTVAQDFQMMRALWG